MGYAPESNFAVGLVVGILSTVGIAVLIAIVVASPDNPARVAAVATSVAAVATVAGLLLRRRS